MSRIIGFSSRFGFYLGFISVEFIAVYSVLLGLRFDWGLSFGASDPAWRKTFMSAGSSKCATSTRHSVMRKKGPSNPVPRCPGYLLQDQVRGAHS